MTSVEPCFDATYHVYILSIVNAFYIVEFMLEALDIMVYYITGEVFDLVAPAFHFHVLAVYVVLRSRLVRRKTRFI